MRALTLFLIAVILFWTETTDYNKKMKIARACGLATSECHETIVCPTGCGSSEGKIIKECPSSCNPHPSACGSMIIPSQVLPQPQMVSQVLPQPQMISQVLPQQQMVSQVLPQQQVISSRAIVPQNNVPVYIPQQVNYSNPINTLGQPITQTAANELLPATNVIGTPLAFR